MTNTYRPPASAIREALSVARAAGIVDGNTAADAFDRVVTAAADVVARDVVEMTAAALKPVEQHDPSCLSLYAVDDEEECDCSWSAIAAVIATLKTKVGIVT
jgi:hypothetical protein